MIDITNVRKLADAVRSQTAELNHRVDVYEAIASTSRRRATVDRIEYDLRILRRDLERLVEILDERRSRIGQINRIA